MIMDHETILELYHKSQEEGDPVEQIKSLAKLNNCSTGEIRKILLEHGEFVSRQKPGPKPKAAVINKSGGDIEKIIEAAGAKAVPAVDVYYPKESAEAAAGEAEAEEKMIRMSFILKECVFRGVADIKQQLQKKREEVEAGQKEIESLETLYALAKMEFINVLFKEEAFSDDKTRFEAGQITGQTCNNNLS